MPAWTFTVSLSKWWQVTSALREAGLAVEVLHDDGKFAVIRCGLDGYDTVLEVGPGTADEPDTFEIVVRAVTSIVHPLRSRRLFSRINAVLLALGGRLET